MDWGAWWAAVHGVAKSQTPLSDFTFTFHFHALEKEMATHSSTLAWRIPGTEEPSGLLSMESHRVGHDWSNLAAAATSLCWTWSGEGWVNVMDQWKMCGLHWSGVLQQVTLLGLSFLTYMTTEGELYPLENPFRKKFWEPMLQIHRNLNVERNFKGGNGSKMTCFLWSSLSVSNFSITDIFHGHWLKYTFVTHHDSLCSIKRLFWGWVDQ